MFDEFQIMVSSLFQSITVTDLKPDDSFLKAQFSIDSFSVPFRLDWNNNSN